jgi:hypothetical protein
VLLVRCLLIVNLMVKHLSSRTRTFAR